MSLTVTPVSKCLDKKTTIAGFEVPDLFVIFTTMSVLNLVLGWTEQRLLLVWLPTIALALAIRYGKRGKPDGYIAHWLKFKFSKKHLSAFPRPTNYLPPNIGKGDLT